MQFLLIAVGCLAGVGLIMSMNGPLMVLGVFLLCFIFWRSAQAVGGRRGMSRGSPFLSMRVSPAQTSRAAALAVGGRSIRRSAGSVLPVSTCHRDFSRWRSRLCGYHE